MAHRGRPQMSSAGLRAEVRKILESDIEWNQPPQRHPSNDSMTTNSGYAGRDFRSTTAQTGSSLGKGDYDANRSAAAQTGSSLFGGDYNDGESDMGKSYYSQRDSSGQQEDVW